LNLKKIEAPILILHGDEDRGARPRASWVIAAIFAGLAGTAGWTRTTGLLIHSQAL
jgi:hypothetical protein